MRTTAEHRRPGRARIRCLAAALRGPPFVFTTVLPPCLCALLPYRERGGGGGGVGDGRGGLLGRLETLGRCRRGRVMPGFCSVPSNVRIPAPPSTHLTRITRT